MLGMSGMGQLAMQRTLSAPEGSCKCNINNHLGMIYVAGPSNSHDTWAGVEPGEDPAILEIDEGMWGLNRKISDSKTFASGTLG